MCVSTSKTVRDKEGRGNARLPWARGLILLMRDLRWLSLLFFIGSLSLEISTVYEIVEFNPLFIIYEYYDF